MKFKGYKHIYFIALLMVSQALMAQTPPEKPQSPVTPEKPATRIKPGAPLPPKKPATISKGYSFELKEHNLKLKEHNELLKKLDIELKDLNVKLSDDFTSKLKLNLKEIELFKEPEFNFKHDFNFEFDGDKNKSQLQSPNTVEKVKRVTKSYRVNSKDKLAINNQYGKVVINVWPKNEIKVDIEIKAYEASESDAQKLLDGVTIDESESDDLISFKTNITQSTSGWGMKRLPHGNEKKRGVSIDYVVHMPSGNPLDIINKFGGVSITDFEGPINIKNSYGSVTGVNLQNPANSIDVKYGSASIEKYTGGTINVTYGGLKISNANQVKADVKYGSTKIGKLSNGGNLENKYGSIKIDELSNNTKPLIITADKGSVVMGMKSSSNFDFDVTVNMGGFQYPDERIVITSKTPEATGHPKFVKNYKGEFGKGSENLVQIKCNYGSVKFE